MPSGRRPSLGHSGRGWKRLPDGKIPREVLAWASEGKTAWEIGCILSISQRTVEWHMRQACKKLGATNRSQAIAILGDARISLDPTEDAASHQDR
jgi:DNA-binding CsgD family transcriptional regulator